MEIKTENLLKAIHEHNFFIEYLQNFNKAYSFALFRTYFLPHQQSIYYFI